jgi:translocation and assembly module TamB
VSVISRSLSIVWRTLAAVVLVLFVALAALSAALATHQGSHWLLGQLSSVLNNDGQSVVYQSAEGTFLRGISLTGIRWQQADNSVSIAQLHSRWNPLTLLEGEFMLESLRIAGLQIDWAAQTAPTPPSAPLILDNVINAFLPLPVSVHLNNARIDGAVLRTNGQAYSLLSLMVDASLQGETIIMNEFLVDTGLVSLKAGAELTLQSPYPLSADIDWQYARPLLENTAAPSGQLRITGDLDLINIDHQLSGPAELHSTGSIRLNLAQLLNARADSQSPELDLEHTLSALAVPGMEQIQVNSLTLITQGTPDNLALTATARVSASPSPGLFIATAVDAQANLRGNRLMLDELALRTDTGLLTIQGDMQWAQAETQTRTLSQSANQPRLAMALRYQLDDSSPQRYLANLPDNVSMANLSSRGELQLRQSPAPESAWQIAFATPQISALLNGYELSGNGGFNRDGERWQIDEFNLRNGDNRIEISALLDNLSGELQADLLIDVPQPGAFYPQLQGQIAGNATVSGTVQNPVIDVDVSARALQLGQLSAPEVTMTGQNRAGMNELEIRGSNLRFLLGEQAETIEQFTLRLRGQPDAHNILLLLDSSVAQARINADVTLGENGWQGRLLSSEFDSDLGNWQQTAPADVQLQADQMSISALCWQMQSTQLCAQAQLAGTDQLTATATLDNFPLAAFNLPQTEQTLSQDAGMVFFNDTAAQPPLRMPVSLPAGVAVNGMISVSASASGPINHWREMSIKVTADSRGDLYVRTGIAEQATDADELADTALTNHFVWSSLQFEATQQDGGWQSSSQLAFFQQDSDSQLTPMRGSANATANLDADENLSGQLQLQFDDLGWLEGLVPQISQVGGSLGGQLDLSGTLDNPRVRADLSLEDGSLAVQALGIELQGIETTLASAGPDRLLINGVVQSSDGRLNFSSQIDNVLSDTRKLDVSIAGADFTLANLPDLQLTISPDIRLQADAQGINVSGQLFVPLLNAEINTLPETAVDVSSDVIIVQIDGSTPVRNAALTEQAVLGGVPLSGELRLILGDNVQVAGFGLNAQVRGQLDIRQRPNTAPLTYGELQVVQGSFATYGRTLDIEQGRLLFMGSLDNPAIDIRAVREVENIRVGVQMNGTIRNINSSLFSVPMLADADILSVMITGMPIAEIGTQQDGNALIGAMTSLGISQSQGMANQIRNQLGLDAFSINSSGDVNDSRLMLGKYITPRIFIRYAVGLFETENSLAIDYTVNDRVKLEATSGQTQSIDLTYTVEQ